MKKVILLAITLLNIKYTSVKGSLIVLLGGEAAGGALLQVPAELALKAGMAGGCPLRSGEPGGSVPSHPATYGGAGARAALQSRAADLQPPGLT